MAREEYCIHDGVGEEKGLLGSAITEHPLFPLELHGNLNTDMIGRYDALHSADTNYIYLIGADRMSTELHQISERINGIYTNMKLDYKYNDKIRTRNVFTQEAIITIL